VLLLKTYAGPTAIIIKYGLRTMMPGSKKA
jgi:hypothetical protein